MKILIISLFFVGLTTLVFAGQKYNPYTNQWETVPNNYEMKYNPYDNEWTYQHPQAQQEYNPYNNTWDYCPPETNTDPAHRDYYKTYPRSR